jgi:hypothetical protein
VGRVGGRDHERGDADEHGTALGHVGQLADQQVQVGLVVAVLARPAGRQHARHAVQRVHRQPGVVGDGRQPGVSGDRVGLEQGVVGERGAGLGHVGRVRERLEPDDLHVTADPAPDPGQDPRQFGDLARVPGGEHHAAAAVSHRFSR